MATFEVSLRVYDLSKGMVAGLSQMILGRRVEGVWHSGVKVYDTEYFFGGFGLLSMPPHEVETQYEMKPAKVLSLGNTSKTKDEFHTYLLSLTTRFGGDSYHLIKHNCNHFSDDAARFLVGTGIPHEILNQHEEIANAPMGDMILKAIDAWQQHMQEQSTATLPATSGNRAAAADPQKLEELKAMGFSDDDRLKRILRQANNDISRVLDIIEMEDS